MSETWVRVDEVQGMLQAEILAGLLRAQGLEVRLSQESAAAAIGLNVGPMGVVEIQVPQGQEARARKVLEDYYAGKFEVD
jgi:hypothetical protein